MRTAGRRGGPRGFTLVEVLAALGIAALAVMGVLAVFASAVRSYRRARDGMEAANIANSLAAEARAVFTIDRTLEPVTGGHWPGKHRYTYDVTYVPLDKEGDEVLMHVRVHWKEGGEPVPLDFDTILLRKME